MSTDFERMTLVEIYILWDYFGVICIERYDTNPKEIAVSDETHICVKTNRNLSYADFSVLYKSNVNG